MYDLRLLGGKPVFQKEKMVVSDYSDNPDVDGYPLCLQYPGFVRSYAEDCENPDFGVVLPFVFPVQIITENTNGPTCREL